MPKGNSQSGSGRRAVGRSGVVEETRTDAGRGRPVCPDATKGPEETGNPAGGNGTGPTPLRGVASSAILSVPGGPKRKSQLIRWARERRQSELYSPTYLLP